MFTNIKSEFPCNHHGSKIIDNKNNYHLDPVSISGLNILEEKILSPYVWDHYKKNDKQFHYFPVKTCDPDSNTFEVGNLAIRESFSRTRGSSKLINYVKNTVIITSIMAEYIAVRTINVRPVIALFSIKDPKGTQIEVAVSGSASEPLTFKNNN